MNNRQFNGVYRPLVKAAWSKFCASNGTATNNKEAYDTWYRQLLHDLTDGIVHSTKGIDDKTQRYLISAFQGHMPKPCKRNFIPIKGWKKPQILRFEELATKAWQAAVTNGTSLKLVPWIEAIFTQHKVAGDSDLWVMSNCTKSFDNIMADLAITAGDDYWIKRTASQSEIRLRYQLNRYLVDLNHIDPTNTYTWAYVRGMYKQSASLPIDINDCPAQTLWKLVAMLDTHIRRLCDKQGIRPKELPTRIPEYKAPLTIRIKRQPATVETREEDIVPF